MSKKKGKGPSSGDKLRRRRVKVKKTQESQVTRDLTYRMNNPEPMNPKEIADARNAGLVVKGQFCESKI